MDTKDGRSDERLQPSQVYARFVCQNNSTQSRCTMIPMAESEPLAARFLVPKRSTSGEELGNYSSSSPSIRCRCLPGHRPPRLRRRKTDVDFDSWSVCSCFSVSLFSLAGTVAPETLG